MLYLKTTIPIQNITKMIKFNTINIDILLLQQGHFKKLICCLFIVGCAGSSCVQSVCSCDKQGLLSRGGVRASHFSGISCCGACVLGMRAQELPLSGWIPLHCIFWVTPWSHCSTEYTGPRILLFSCHRPEDPAPRHFSPFSMWQLVTWEMNCCPGENDH